ncbi:lipopolysaccharide biosynthesis protein [Roseivivax sediminis]|uniref:Membrane protein involved in the export of O-antigen and teichoic acid n=1 Tax=Roseivivax sediminis TaxID=936889 RepID=A0A1I2DE35_9RHOB|nr:hypothetical protein [Roseivivax sediminis]SFE78855.1 Membrane protein involved in the export of O-antigen and teichoic acid [Roseivivax sediminis]
MEKGTPQQADGREPDRAGTIVLSRRLVSVNSASSVANRLLSVTVLVWLFQYLVNRLPTEEFAIYPVVMAVMVVAPLFFSLFTGGMARFLIDAYARSDFDAVRGVVSSVLPVLIGAVALFWMVGLTFALNVEKVLKIPVGSEVEARAMMALLVLTYGIRMLVSPFTLGFQIRQAYVELNILEIGRELLRISVLTLFFLLAGPAVVWVVVATAISELVLSAVAVWRSRRLVPELTFDRAFASFAVARRLTSFGIWTSLGQLGGIMYTNAATLILNLHGTPMDVTCFFLGATLYRQTEMLIITAIGPLLPVVTALNATGDRVRLATTVLRGGRYALWASMLIATPAIVFSDIFVRLYIGDEYGRAALVIILFMSIFPVNQATALLAMTALATGRVRAFYLPAFIAQAAGLSIMLALASWYGAGAIGMAAALALVTIASQLLYFWWLNLRLIGAGFSAFLASTLVPGLVPAVVGAGVWIGMRFLVTIESWVELFACGAAGAVAFGLAILVFGLEPAARSRLLARAAPATGWMRHDTTDRKTIPDAALR